MYFLTYMVHLDLEDQLGAAAGDYSYSCAVGQLMGVELHDLVVALLQQDQEAVSSKKNHL